MFLEPPQLKKTSLDCAHHGHSQLNGGKGDDSMTEISGRKRTVDLDHVSFRSTNLQRFDFGGQDIFPTKNCSFS